MDYLSDLGGLFSALFVVGKVFVSSYLKKLFYATIIQELYSIKHPNKQVTKREE